MLYNFMREREDEEDGGYMSLSINFSIPEESLHEKIGWKGPQMRME